MAVRKPPDFDLHPISFSQAMEIGLYRAMCYHVVDGDTADFLIDLGFFNYSYISLRFLGIDTPETRGTSGEERELALAAMSRVQELILNQPVLVRSFREQTSFGRFLGEIWFYSEDSFPDTINALIIDLEGSNPITAIPLIELMVAEGFDKSVLIEV